MLIHRLVSGQGKTEHSRHSWHWVCDSKQSPHCVRLAFHAILHSYIDWNDIDMLCNHASRRICISVCLACLSVLASIHLFLHFGNSRTNHLAHYLCHFIKPVYSPASKCLPDIKRSDSVAACHRTYSFMFPWVALIIPCHSCDLTQMVICHALIRASYGYAYVYIFSCIKGYCLLMI